MTEVLAVVVRPVSVTGRGAGDVRPEPLHVRRDRREGCRDLSYEGHSGLLDGAIDVEYIQCYRRFQRVEDFGQIRSSAVSGVALGAHHWDDAGGAR
jgi:hypothetical protein